MSQDPGFGAGVEGVVLAAFFASSAVFQLPAGHFVDWWGERIVCAIAVAWWSVFSAATAAAQSFTALIALRLGLGAGEAGGYPAYAKAVSQWFPTRERTFATSVYDSGSRAGTALALPIVTGLIAWLGWRVSFVVALVLSGALALVGAFSYLVIVQRIEPLPMPE